jgi:DNA-binding PadR family transcriptional regulator
MLLGLLAVERQHGYQINEFIERNLSRVSRMPKATAYSMLARLERSGLISATTEQEGNRPPRRVYALTAAGQARYLAMLEDLLANPEQREPPGDHALMFIDSLAHATAARAIEERVAALDREIARLEASPPHEVGIGVDLAIDRRAALARADRDWFIAALDRVRRELPERPGAVLDGEATSM